MDDGSAKWKCNETKSKGNGPFFPANVDVLEGGSTNKAYQELGNNLCTKNLEITQPRYEVTNQ
jgi:hypothetical protein